MTAPFAENGNAEPARHPASFSQRRLWFLDQLRPGVPVFNIPTATRITGPLDAALLRRCLLALVERHESLRTRFQTEDGVPRQVVLPAGDLSSALALPVEKTANLEQVWQEEFHRAFSLEKGPLFHARLVEIAPQERVLFWNAHHIVYDMWSHHIFLKELAGLLAAKGDVSALPALELQYGDYAHWEQEVWFSGKLEPQMAFWTESLQGELPLANLPRRQPASCEKNYEGAMRSRSLGAALAAEVKAASQREKATPQIFFLAVYACLLNRYCGQEEVMIGMPATHRTSRELESMIGFFTNVLPLRIRVPSAAAFQEVLSNTRAAVLEACEHQDLPFEKLVESLRPQARADQDPFFNTILDTQSRPYPAFEAAGLRFEPLPIQTRSAKYDLSLFLKERDGGLFLEVEHSKAFEPEWIDRLFGHFGNMLRGALANPACPVWQLPLLSPEERQQILVDWNWTEAPFPRHLTVPEVFDEQAARAPDSVALAFGAEQWTYAQLAARSIAFASWLHGKTSEAFVGLCLERSPDLIAAILGILRAGKAYLPLEMDAPAERNRSILAQSGTTLLLTQRALLERLPKDGVRVVCVEDCPAHGASLTDGERQALVSPESPAYAMHTSGSTGTPKGVVVTHRNILRLVKNNPYVPMGPGNTFLQLAPVAFDASTFEIWAPLLNGGKLAIAPPGPLTLGEIGAAIAQHGVTTLWLTAGLFHQMIEECPQALAPVKRLLAGGDVLSPRHIEKFLGLAGGELINGYGPTENTTFSCCANIRREDLASGAAPIGRPIANTQAYILDQFLQPVPAGVTGELYLGGEGLALGYLNQPELTRERFLPNPFRTQGGERLYRTGDLVRHRFDGQIDFLGRADQQLKIRGFRVEPGEIESAALRHPGVRQCAVVAQPDGSGGKRLAAFVVWKNHAAPETDSLRELLQAELPAYMIPASFASLEQLPLNANGKVDRKALAARAPAAAAVSEPARPRNACEEQILALWKDLLGTQAIGVQDDFFALGGHSLLATRAVARLGKQLGAEISLREFFEARTIEKLAQLAQQRQSSGPSSASAAIGKRIERRRPASTPAPAGVPGNSTAL